MNKIQEQKPTGGNAMQTKSSLFGESDMAPAHPATVTMPNEQFWNMPVSKIAENARGEGITSAEYYEQQIKSGIGNSLLTLRIIAGLSIEQVSEAAETVPAYLSKVENGIVTPDIGFVKRVTAVIAESIKVSA